ncbi:type IV secretory pathway protein [Candidatus Bathyarchaeota archaeon]|nr:type II/IV secretion system ATPase subunit [Candidatus Bathyarchaeota archaeon]NIR16777.1 type II/IV secretion system ATPase subunit [Desulfobacterales bacterium]NIU80690.1 type IV secretory pathway protein [Candidatus Bathyarchaeota archaeon]NIV67307.1 type IV secretory pathway protein [Candidatus Bathyarchaeota archaeon]NIW15870.1 type IV secretory pathway protein [Candidatus Bathyarchaeota archaeon]
MESETKAIKRRRPSVFQEVYPINEPYVYAAIVREPKTQKIRYEVIEPTISHYETEQMGEIKALLMDEIDVSLKEIETPEEAKAYLENKVREVIGDYRLKVAEESIDKLIYYITRDFIGYGKIDPLMKDHLIEDISADGVNIPVYVWHREYESLPTNIIYRDVEELNSFIIRLAYLARKRISLAKPMLDASLPDGSRIQLTYGTEITRRGSTFTIRRFRVDPLTISDLISFNTLSPEMAAYFWYTIEHRASILVAGGVAAGKTTTLNCLSMFIRPEMKVVSVEDTAELNLPHENWIPSVVRPGSGHRGEGAINLFDLLKSAVRQRPDYIIVGEVRGREAYTLFQAMSTGHLAMCTIHAESMDAALRRLESEPMNIPMPLLAMIDTVVVQLRTEIDGRPARRICTVSEMAKLDPQTKDFVTNDVYGWNAKHDAFSYHGRSHVLERIMERNQLSREEIKEELDRRRRVLEWMVRNNIRKHTEVANIIREYYVKPDRVYRKVRVGMR